MIRDMGGEMKGEVVMDSAVADILAGVVQQLHSVQGNKLIASL